MSVNPGDRLWMQFQLTGTTWTQTVTNLATNMAVTFSIDMLGQAQNELYSAGQNYRTTSSTQVACSLSTNVDS